MSLLVVAVGLTVLGSLGSVLLAAGFLLFNDQLQLRAIPWLVSYAVGTLLAVALLALLPEALSQLAPRIVLSTLLAGIMAFFVLEKLVLWRHCHTHDCDAHRTAAPLVLIGDAFHNFLDGAVIGTAVLTSVPLGVTAAIAVAAHEIPHELGDFAILLDAGYSRRRALLLNVLSGASAIAGAIVAIAALDWVPAIGPYVLALAASSFLYIAMADLIPDLHRGRIDARAFRQLLLVAAGIGTVVMLGGIIGNDH